MDSRPRASAERTQTRRLERTQTHAGPAGRAPESLRPQTKLTSPESNLSYQIERRLGEGGFGQVYLAQRLGKSSIVPETICIKVSVRIDGWLREAYFGQLLDKHPRAIRVYDVFPLVRPDGRVLYCLVLEYAPHGDLSAFLERDGKGWPEAQARREIAGILEVLGKLHRGQMLHRDLTPLNVFVCEEPRLKLGDFGIVRQQSDTRGISARTMNTLTAPSDILAGQAPKWQARDDVYQVGQLLAMLLKGNARSRIRTTDVRHLPCSDQLKEIVYRCIGERRKRYENASEMIEALRTPPPTLEAGVLRTLEGVHLAFTGILSKRRSVAARAARRAGAIVHGGPSAKTTVIVRGRPTRCRPRARGRTEADGAKAAAGEGAPDQAAQRSEVLEIGGEGEEEGVVTIDWTIDEGSCDRQSDQGTMDDLALVVLRLLSSDAARKLVDPEVNRHSPPSTLAAIHKSLVYRPPRRERGLTASSGSGGRVEKRVQTRSERLKDMGRAKSRATTTELVPKNA
jgi:serine/threonine-protein kinase